MTRIGSTPDALARAMLKMWNLDPATDVTIVQLNEMGLLVQGLVSGVIDAAPISIPSNIRAKNLGYTELFDMTKIGKTYITGTVVTRKRFIDGQRDTAKRFMRGFPRRHEDVLEDEDFSIKVIQKWTRAKSRDEVKEAYALQAKNMLRIPRTSHRWRKNDSRRHGQDPRRENRRPAPLHRLHHPRRIGKGRIPENLVQELSGKVCSLWHFM